MIGKELMIHLFIWDADPQMSKLATEILRKTVGETQTKRQTERHRQSKRITGKYHLGNKFTGELSYIKCNSTTYS